MHWLLQVTYRRLFSYYVKFPAIFSYFLFQDLFTFRPNTNCDTHDMLSCNCHGVLHDKGNHSIKKDSHLKVSGNWSHWSVKLILVTDMLMPVMLSSLCNPEWVSTLPANQLSLAAFQHHKELLFMPWYCCHCIINHLNKESGPEEVGVTLVSNLLRDINTYLASVTEI